MGQTQSTAGARPSEPEEPSPSRPVTRSFNPFRASRLSLAAIEDQQPLSRPDSTWRRRSSRLLGRRQSTLMLPVDNGSQSDLTLTPASSTNPALRFFRRAQTSVSGRLPIFSVRETRESHRDSSSSLLLDTSPTEEPQPAIQRATSASVETAPPTSPTVLAPNTDHDITQDGELTPLTRHRSSGRPSSLISDRLPSLRPDRLSRTISNTLRRRRSNSARSNEPIPVLSEILTAAAAATAATLMGDDPEAVRNARGIGGDEGTLESFLESLQNGRMASALSRSTQEGNGDGTNRQGVNFVRLFRFGTSTDNRDRASRLSSTSGTGNDGDSSEGRMIPIIIVGIRSINSNGNNVGDHNVPSFINALTGHSDTSAGPGEEAEDSTSRLPNTGSRFNQRRSASLQGYDNQRHHRSLRSRSPRPFLRSTSPRPFSSSTSEASVTPYPPPSTPASAGLSAFSSGATTPNVPSQLGTGSAAPSRRPSVNRNSTGGEPGVDETAQIPRRSTRRRRLSDSDFTRWGSGSPRRNGVVEPDDAENTNARSWIIYVLGGSYPENHPLLNTPSLFTDQPTYEDMLLLSSLIGPAKPPVASQDDVASAPGIYVVRHGEYPGSLIGVSMDTDDLIAIGSEETCLVCLSEFAAEEHARKLVKCGHFFHKECIDQWLTTGRNSCPLCREEGVLRSSSEPISPAAVPIPASP